MSDTNALTDVERKDWQLHDAAVEIAQLRAEKAQRDYLDAHNARAKFQEALIAKYQIDPKADSIDAQTGAITRGKKE
jgi:hypothetical protein